jgi:hypothetical protein
MSVAIAAELDSLNAPTDLTVWPNSVSRANGDAWLMQHHDSLKQMRPRLLVLNFDNHTPRAKLDALVGQIIAGVAEGSRWHGYQDSNAPVFLDYRVARFADLWEAGAAKTNLNAAAFPLKPGVTNDFNVDHNAFFSDAFAVKIGIADPANEKENLRLDELVDRGLIHEVWIITNGDDRRIKAFECIELKPRYDEQFRRVGTDFVQAGNGGDPKQRWTGRSVRLGFINSTRGPGCFLESLSHSFEEMAKCGAIPWLKREFEAFAGFDLKERWGVPFNSFYSLRYGERLIEYPQPDLAVMRPWKGDPLIVSNYFVAGGNAHWPPNARQHYDLDNTNAVLSSIEGWREGGGPAGGDVVKPWTNEAFAHYRASAGDCMGPWLVYWRQNFPGLNNRARDVAGRPMKNWWPFLFY